MLSSLQKIGFKESRISPEHYFLWRQQRSGRIVEELAKLIGLRYKPVLDIGCGYGALSSLLLQRQAYVSATEIDKDKLQFARQKLSGYRRFNSHLVSDERLPFADNNFDAVLMFDVIEHVANPQMIMDECLRTLKPNGYLYVEFTPYYSITGHHLYDYTKLPIHILPRNKIKRIVFSKTIHGFMDQEYYWRQFCSLNKLRIGRFQQMTYPYQKVWERFIIKYPDLFELNIPFIDRLGPFKDYITMSFEGLYKKRG